GCTTRGRENTVPGQFFPDPRAFTTARSDSRADRGRTDPVPYSPLPLQVLPDRPRELAADSRHGGDRLDARLAHARDAAEAAQERLAPGVPDARDRVELRADPAPLLPVVRDR